VVATVVSVYLPSQKSCLPGMPFTVAVYDSVAGGVHSLNSAHN